MKGQKVSFRWFLQLTFNAACRCERGRSFRSQRRRALVAVRWQTETNVLRSVKAQNQRQTAQHIRLLSVKHLDLSKSIFCSSSLHLPRSFSSSCLSKSTLDSSLSFLSSSSETDNCDQTLHLACCAPVWSWRWGWGHGGSARNRDMIKRESASRLHLHGRNSPEIDYLVTTKKRWAFFAVQGSILT